MMFFVTAKRLKAIIDADRIHQLLLQKQDAQRRCVELYNRTGNALTEVFFGPPITRAVPLTSEANDARLAAKKAATKAARPVRKPREKK